MNLDSSKLKDFAEDNFKFDENGKKFSELEENTLHKGQIAREKDKLLPSNFSFSPQCFQKTCTPDM